MFYFLELDEMSIPKLGNQKFSTLAELLQDQDSYNINVSQTSITQHHIILYFYCLQFVYLTLQ